MVGHVSMATCMCEREPLQPPGQKALFFFFHSEKSKQCTEEHDGSSPGGSTVDSTSTNSETFGGLAVSKEHRMESYCSRKLLHAL